MYEYGRKENDASDLMLVVKRRGLVSFIEDVSVQVPISRNIARLIKFPRIA